jgi:hypothetical protein
VWRVEGEPFVFRRTYHALSEAPRSDEHDDPGGGRVSGFLQSL